MRASDRQLRAGSARQEITPAVGSPLSGFIARLGPSTDVAGPLFTRALVLTDRDTSLVLLQMDLLGLARWHVDEIRRACHSLFDILPECVLISTTHTHSGPGMLPLRGCLLASLDYQWSVVKKSVQAIQRAYVTRRPARLWSNRVPFRLGINRRQKTRDGTVLGADPKKAAPKCLDVAEVRMRGGRSCILFSHAAHPYIMGGDQSSISGDFASFACQSLESSPRKTAMFLNGCAGDIAPLRAFEGLAAAREEGNRLAQAIREAISGSREVNLAPLKAFSQQVYLPYSQLPTLQDLEALRLQHERTVRSEERTNPAITAKIRSALDDWADFLKKVVEGKAALEPVFCEVQVFRAGSLCLAAVSGEPFFEIGQRICRSSPLPNTWALGYCNTYTGYLPTERAFREGGYEVSDSFRYLDTWQLHPSCDRLVMKAAHRLLLKVYER
jgi:neutral ceramidase